MEKRRGKVSHGVLLLHDNAPIHMFRLLFARLASLNWITRPILQILHRLITISNLKKFLHLKNFSSDDEAVTTVEDYLTYLNSKFFCKGIQSLHDRWQRVIASEDQYIQ